MSHPSQPILLPTISLGFREKCTLGLPLVIGIALLVIGSLGVDKRIDGLAMAGSITMTTIGSILSFIFGVPAAVLAIESKRVEIENRRRTLHNNQREAAVPERPLAPKEPDFEFEPLPLSLDQERLIAIRNANQESDPVSEIPPQETLRILSYVAYTSGKISSLFKHEIRFVAPQTDAMKNFLGEMSEKNEEELYQAVGTAFLDQLPVLHTFLRKQTEEILLTGQPSQEMKEKWRVTTRQCRAILLFLLSHEPDKKRGFATYQTYLMRSYANYSWNNANRLNGDDPGFSWNHEEQHLNSLDPADRFHKLLTLKENQQKLLSAFLVSFSDYRRHGILRLRHDQDKLCHDVAIRRLLLGTWFHGTRAVTMLEDALIPTGWMQKMNEVPFFGEVKAGIGAEGVNQHNLSGTLLDRVHWSMDAYAQYFQFSFEEERRMVQRFLAFKIDENKMVLHEASKSNYMDEEINVFVQHGQYWARVDIALKRWARWDAVTFEAERNTLLTKVNYLLTCIEKIKQLNPDEIFNWRDTYYSSKYSNTCYALQSMKEFLESPPPPAFSEAKKKNIKHNFPAVFGSLTRLPSLSSVTLGEYHLRDIVRFGKDLQILCVDAKDMAKARVWLAAQFPEGGVELFSFDQLREAQKVNKMLSPQFADIFSVKKFEALCQEYRVMEVVD